jgi:hypothetical protein
MSGYCTLLTASCRPLQFTADIIEGSKQPLSPDYLRSLFARSVKGAVAMRLLYFDYFQRLVSTGFRGKTILLYS